MKEKGFTLVELLAVIVILAIIALIAVPMILGVIEKARKKSAIISAKNYMYAVEQYIVLQEVENYSVKLQNNTTYKVEEDTAFEFSLMDMIIPKVYALPSETVFLNDIIKIKGEYPKDGYVEIGENKILVAELVTNDYIVTCASSTDCNITGNYESSIIAVQSIEIVEVEKTEIEVGETLQLSTTVLPEDATNKKVTWTSSDSSIATVDENGLVTANKRGTVTITVTTNNLKTDTIELTIKGIYQEDILNGADPVIAGNLIPVTINSDGTVYQADIKEEWYSYGKRLWANAIVLKDGITLETAKKEDGTIDNNNIKQYYVWIPRYKYQLWNVNSEALYPNGTEGPSAINIVFESKSTTVSNGTANGEWLTHPAFQTFNTNGIWVGKFETSYDEETYTVSSNFATKNPNYAAATSSSSIIIKPNVRSLTNKAPSQFYTLSSGVNTELNSHMIKNSEWGAVAYLTYSNYGKCDNEGCEEVYINNVNTGYYPASSAAFSGQWQYSGTITGCSGATADAGAVGSQSACASGYAWNGANNKASTTGNISGIYDMNGGNWEYMMGVLEYGDTGLPVSGKNNSYNSGFNGKYSAPTTNSQTALEKTNGIAFPDSRYYDLYHYNYTMGGNGSDISYDYTTGHLGDAVKEVAVTGDSSNDRGLWFSDLAYFPAATYPWVYRGGNFGSGSGSGVFSFSRAGGSAYNFYASRVVLAY